MRSKWRLSGMDVPIIGSEFEQNDQFDRVATDWLVSCCSSHRGLCVLVGDPCVWRIRMRKTLPNQLPSSGLLFFLKILLLTHQLRDYSGILFVLHSDSYLITNALILFGQMLNFVVSYLINKLGKQPLHWWGKT